MNCGRGSSGGSAKEENPVGIVTKRRVGGQLLKRIGWCGKDVAGRGQPRDENDDHNLMEMMTTKFIVVDYPETLFKHGDNYTRGMASLLCEVWTGMGVREVDLDDAGSSCGRSESLVLLQVMKGPGDPSHGCMA